MNLLDAGAYTLNVSGHGSLINGTWEVTQDQVTFTETSGLLYLVEEGASVVQVLKLP